MVRSTAGLGRELGLNSQEMNILLRDEGYLEGEPGDWKLTDKGRACAGQQHWDVSSPMHAGYVTTRWDDEVLENIGPVSPERKQEIRGEIAARRAEQRRQREELQAECEIEAEDGPDSPGYAVADEEDIDIDGKTVGIAIAVIAGGILLAKGAKRAKPRVEEWWVESALPKLTVVKERVVAKFKKAEHDQIGVSPVPENEGELESLHIEDCATN